MPDLSSYNKVKEYLYGLKNSGSKYGIDRMHLLARELGNPEQSFPCIHIAGTNGKGSTASLLEAALRKAGYKTGLFTSPHLVHQGERIQVNRSILSHEKITQYTRKLQPIAEKLDANDPEDHPSFFEFMTAMAFLHFANEEVDIAILETGLGGEFDSTNIVYPLVSIITSISLDHTAILGDSYTEIAKAKAGIIKENTPIILGPVSHEAEKVIVERSKRKNASLIHLREKIDPNNYPQTNLVGEFQKQNAALASLCLWEIQESFPVSKEEMDLGFQNTYWPARWEKRHLLDDKTLILDTSHNPEGAIELDKNLRSLRKKLGYKPSIIVGVLGTDRAAALLKCISQHAKDIVLCKPQQARATNANELRALIPNSFSGEVIEMKINTLIPKTKTLSLGKKGETFVSTGSIYLQGEILEALEFENSVNEQLLQD